MAAAYRSRFPSPAQVGATALDAGQADTVLAQGEARAQSHVLRLIMPDDFMGKRGIFARAD